MEGIFRKSLEVVLGTAREHKSTLLNVLEPFLRDPTVGWARSGKAQRDANDPPHRENCTPDPTATLETISQRLEGTYTSADIFEETGFDLGSAPIVLVSMSFILEGGGDLNRFHGSTTGRR